MVHCGPSGAGHAVKAVNNALNAARAQSEVNGALGHTVIDIIAEVFTGLRLPTSCLVQKDFWLFKSLVLTRLWPWMR